jgi:hypothetical protein
MTSSALLTQLALFAARLSLFKPTQAPEDGNRN